MAVYLFIEESELCDFCDMTSIYQLTFCLNHQIIKFNAIKKNYIWIKLLWTDGEFYG